MNDHRDFRQARYMRHHRMGFQFAELPRKGNLLRGIDVVVIEEQDFPIQQRIFQRGILGG